MPRVNLALSDEAKAVLVAFQKEKGLRQDEAANALLLEFANLHDITESMKEQNHVVAILVQRLGGSVEINDIDLIKTTDLYLSRDDRKFGFNLKLVSKE
jgi:hypothetical protein